MKKYFITGLILLTPLVLTIIIVMFVINFLTNPFLELVDTLFASFGWLSFDFGLIKGDQVRLLISRILILFSLLGFTVLLGALAQWFVLNWLIKTADSIIHRIPLISSVYTTFQDLFKTIFSTDTSSFKQVVMVPFPGRDSQTIGLITNDKLMIQGFNGRVAVFVPTTPNPTSGFLLFVNRSDIVYLDLPVEDAVKYVVSCGVVAVPFIETVKKGGAV